MNRICVFCGSSIGGRLGYVVAARELGQALAARNITLVYGGARVGTMGAVADAALAAGGRVIGVIPRFLVEKEVAHTGLTELKIVESMEERKVLMAELSDGFIALPGGLGTMDELFEMATWAQLARHAKPCGLLNVCGYYDRLVAFLDHMAAEFFLRGEHRELITIGETPEQLLQLFADYQAPVVTKWVDMKN